MRTLAGGGTEPRVDGVPAVATALDGPDRRGDRRRRRRVASPSPARTASAASRRSCRASARGDALIASPDGAQVYQFNLDGRHVRTLDALTGAVLRRFTYDARGGLAGVFDDAAGASPAHSALRHDHAPDRDERRADGARRRADDADPRRRGLGGGRRATPRAR